MGDPGVTGKTRARSIAISDTIGVFDDRLLLTYGLRRQQLRVESYTYDGTTSQGQANLANDGSRKGDPYEESITTPVYGIVFKATDSISLYANRIEGLAQGPTAPANVSNANEMFPPGRTKQLEAGIKFDRETFGANLAVFRIEKPSDGYTLNNVFIRDGEQVNKGLELSLFGEPVQGLRLMAGGTRMTSEQKKNCQRQQRWQPCHWRADVPAQCQRRLGRAWRTWAGAECEDAAHRWPVRRCGEQRQFADLEPFRCRCPLQVEGSGERPDPAGECGKPDRQELLGLG